MDTSEYLPMFLAEAREHLQELNVAVVALEDNPSDRPTVDQIFRIAHSLKGMSATMGFAQIAELTHEMEDVFELLRQRSSGLEAAAVDTVLACLDALSASIESIEADGQEQLDPAPLIARLRHLVRARSPEQALERAGGAELPDLPQLEAARAAGARVLHILVKLDEHVLMPAVRAHMVFTAVAAHGELIGSVPATDGIERFSGHELEAWLASEHSEADVASSALSVSDVGGVEVRELPPWAPPPEAPGEEPEDLAVAPVASGVSGAGPPEAAIGIGPAGYHARTLRVEAERLDALLHMMGELVIHRTRVEALTAGIESPELHLAVQNLSRTAQSLKEMVLQVRMIPVDIVLARFPRLVRDLSTKLGKDVELELVGRDTELDRTVVDALGDPLVHLIRNAVDHGLEPPEVRLAAGKPRVGKLTIEARHAGSNVVIEVRDDGRGIDAAAIARKAVDRGMIDPSQAAVIDQRTAIDLLFAAGLSTAESTSDVSGRGVGMDAVRAGVRELGGEVLLESVPGHGTTATIRLPLTLAIVTGLQVDIGGAPFAIPIDRIERTLQLDPARVRSISGRRVLALDDGMLPLLEGSTTFGQPPSDAHQLVVIVRAGDRRVGLTVDGLVGQRELVTRPLPQIVADGQAVSSGAVLADGQIALIIDCDALASAGGDGRAMENSSAIPPIGHPGLVGVQP